MLVCIDDWFAFMLVCIDGGLHWCWFALMMVCNDDLFAFMLVCINDWFAHVRKKCQNIISIMFVDCQNSENLIKPVVFQ